ncbi:hypothetical protein ACFL3J_02365 [Candidatus Omnitrophota bacterium]
MHLLETKGLMKEYGGRRVVDGVDINVTAHIKNTDPAGLRPSSTR